MISSWEAEREKNNASPVTNTPGANISSSDSVDCILHRLLREDIDLEDLKAVVVSLLTDGYSTVSDLPVVIDYTAIIDTMHSKYLGYVTILKFTLLK